MRSSPETVYERVKARQRPEEEGLSLEYLKGLHESHERWLMTDDTRFNTIPVLVLNADKTLDEIVNQYKENEQKILGIVVCLNVLDPDSKKMRNCLHI